MRSITIMILFMLIFSAYSANIVLAETDGNVNDLSIKENEQKELMKAEYPSSLTLLNDYPTYTSSDLKTSQYLDTRSFDSDSNLFSSDTELDACACDKDCNTVSENSNYTSFQNFDSIRSSLTPHNPITISSDEDFISHGFSGAGTDIDPYRIEYLEIVTDAFYSISINGTTKHFVISNCYIEFTGFDCFRGLIISSISDYTGSITDNVLVNSKRAIVIQDTTGIYIGNNTFSNNRRAINVENSPFTTVTGNTIENNYGCYSIYIDSSENSTLVYNHLLNVDRGIFINYSPFTTVSDNRIEYSYCYGVKFFYSHDSVVTNNILVDSGIRIEESVLIDYVSYTFSNNTLNTKPIGYFVNQDGLVINTNFYSQLFLINCTNTSISSQNFTNYYLGIFAFYCSSLTIESNNFNGNNKGIHILSSNSIIIQDNSFSNNKKAILVSSSSIVYIANNIIGDSTGWCPTLEVIFSSSVSIFYNTLINVHRGIKLYMSSASVSNNSVSNSHCFGIHFTDSTAINFTSNNLVESGVYIEEYTISEYSNYQVANNYINDKLLGWFIHEAGLTLDSSLYNQIILVNCSNSVISNQELMNSYIGIYAIFCTSLTITNNYFNKCNRGIVVIESENVFVSYNFLDEISRGMYFRNIHNSTIIDNTLLSIKCIAIYCQFSSNITFAYNYIDNYNNWADVGLNIEESHSVVVKQNIITNYFWRAIDVQHSTYLTISENVLTQNELGIYFWFSSNSSIMNNIIKDNYEFGVSLQSGSTYNTIYHNIFSNNRIDSGFIGSQGLDSGSNNDWYNTTLLEGNQWSDWSGSAAYTIEGSANSNDFYPMDLEGPQITDILITPAIPYPLQDIIVTATVIDNFALDMVSIFYSINNGSWVLGSMTANDDSYSFAFGSFNAYDFIQFYIVANDTSGNSVQTEIHSFTISPDTDAPTITSIYHSPSTPLINQEITISATVTDNVEVSIVYLYYRVNTGDWIQVEMTKSSSSSVYTASIGAFDGSVEIFYYIYAVDSSDNVTESNTIDFVVVLDEESPVITNVSHSPNTPKKDDNIVVRASVSDNIALHQVILYYRIDEGSWATIIMIFSTTNYKATINEPFEAGALIEYYVYAIDTSGNDAQSTIYSVNISDDTVPDDDDNDDNDDTELTVPLSFGSLAFFVLSLAVCATVNFIVFRRK